MEIIPLFSSQAWSEQTHVCELCKQRRDIFIATYNDFDARWYISVHVEFLLKQVMSTFVQATTRPHLSASSVPLASSLCEKPELHEEAQASLRVARKWRRADCRSWARAASQTLRFSSKTTQCNGGEGCREPWTLEHIYIYICIYIYIYIYLSIYLSI